jgi:hypothetical protein
MQEKCDLLDAVERMHIKEIKEEQKKVGGIQKLLPFQKPWYALHLGIFLLGVS